ncbi:MAG: peptidase M14 [Flavobacterium sp.]|nr:peptidase M14 [Flavobacterium sp.]
MDLELIYESTRLYNLSGRYITNNHIEPYLSALNKNCEFKNIGYSVNKLPIYSYKIGSGSIKILIWSQMHGNESTTTKAVIDFINFLNLNLELSKSILNDFTFFCIPVLNPDGATLYTRENANKIDLNRDFVNLSQPESNILLNVFKEFKPDYCYNMHDQRTIFGIKSSMKPATVSFLAPSYNEERAFNEKRLKAANLIVAMNDCLQQYIPNQVGRFDDGFNISCVGDFFQSLGVPTILFEAGHFQDDYNRELTRKYIFGALISGVIYLQKKSTFIAKINDYLNIPQNFPHFFDIIYRNVKILEHNQEKIINFAVQFVEKLIYNTVEFDGIINKIEGLEEYFGHLEVDCNFETYKDDSQNIPISGCKADFSIGNKKYINGLEVEII